MDSSRWVADTAAISLIRVLETGQEVQGLETGALLIEEPERRRIAESVAGHIGEQAAEVVGISEIWDLDLALAIADAVADTYPHTSLIRFDLVDRVSEVTAQTLQSERLGSIVGTLVSLGASACELVKDAIAPGDRVSTGASRRLYSGLLLLARESLTFARRPRFFPVRANIGVGAHDRTSNTPGVLMGEVSTEAGTLGVFFTHSAGAWQRTSPRGAPLSDGAAPMWSARDKLLNALVATYRTENPEATVALLVDDPQEHWTSETAPDSGSGADIGDDVAVAQYRSRPTLTDLVLDARTRVSDVADDPIGRYALRERWYQRWGNGLLDTEGYGRSELDFLAWEIERGVLNPLSHAYQPGSRWWRSMQEQYAFFAHLSGMIYDAGLARDGLPNSIVSWLEYLDRPTPESWYRAHNVNIIRGYLDWTHTAQFENYPEQLLLNKILYRVLFAQAMTEGHAFGWLGERMADPRFVTVNLMVELDALYPRDYPLDRRHMEDLVYRGKGVDEELARLLDCELILPHLPSMYAWAAAHNREPGLQRLVNNGNPVYPYHDWYAQRVLC